MSIYIEGALWYLLLADCLGYNFLSWTKGRSHQYDSHWLSAHISLNPAVGVGYLTLTLWLGFLLYRMQLLGFYLG